ncbi:MAG: hypothetical protein AAGA60_08460 [Cyanobacteria bacterium P01_E01_bin.42]
MFSRAIGGGVWVIVIQIVTYYEAGLAIALDIVGESGDRQDRKWIEIGRSRVWNKIVNQIAVLQQTS